MNFSPTSVSSRQITSQSRSSRGWLKIRCKYFGSSCGLLNCSFKPDSETSRTRQEIGARLLSRMISAALKMGHRVEAAR